MSFARRNFVRSIFALGAALTVAMPALAQTAGKDLKLIFPTQPTGDATKIEVLEFFSYGCPHCSDFHPLISAWAAKQPGDVVFKRVPVSFGRAAWANLAKLYYTLEATGDLARLDGEVFKAIHNDRINLADEKTMTEWVVKKGVQAKKFAETYSLMNEKVEDGDKKTQSYVISGRPAISGVPAIVVDGKYLIQGNSFGELLSNTDKTIAKMRAEKPAKK